ncbi:MAG TPA: hypothetical protein VMB84_15710 [Stellaceae bacterium]|nr:hypothetical protein [Stellaceae bacterium]
MADPIRTYLDALHAYEAERLKARELIGLIGQVANALQYNLPQFVVASCGLELPAAPGDRFRPAEGAAIDLHDWPDAERLRAGLTAWHAAFVALRAAWDAIPAADQKGMKEPPPTLFAG